MKNISKALKIWRKFSETWGTQIKYLELMIRLFGASKKLDYAHEKWEQKLEKFPKSLYRLLDGRGTKRSDLGDKEKILESF